MLEQAGPHERRAQPVKRDGRKQHPDRDGPEPGRGAESLARQDECPEQRVEQDENLIAEQLVLDQPTTGHRSREEKGHLRGAEGQHPPLDPEHPAPEQRPDHTDGADELQPPCPHQYLRRMPRPFLDCDHPEIREPEQQREKVPWTAQLPKLARHPVVGGAPGQIPEESDHASSAPSGAISARNTSSSRRPLSAGRLATISATVPRATACPAFMTRMRVQISSTRCSRCELRMTAVPL